MLTTDEQELLKYARQEVNNQSNGDTLRPKLREVKNNKEFMLSFVYKCAHALKYASKELQDDDEVVALALDHGYYGIEYASDRIKSNIDVMRKVITDERRLGLLKYASDEIKDNREIALLAVTHDAQNLRYVNKRLLGDEEIVMTAMQQSAYLIELASEEIKNKPDFFIFACKQRGENIRYAPEHLKDNDELGLATVSNSGQYLNELSDRLKNDKTIVLAACENYELAIVHASSEIVQLVGDNAPVHFLKSWLLQEKLEKVVPNKNEEKTKKFKI